MQSRAQRNVERHLEVDSRARDGEDPGNVAFVERRAAELDYGIAEPLAFLKASGVAWEDTFVAEAARWCFAGVWRLQPIALDAAARADRVRVESPERRERLHELIGEIYMSLGIAPQEFAPGAAERLARAQALLRAAR